MNGKKIKGQEQLSLGDTITLGQPEKDEPAFIVTDRDAVEPEPAAAEEEAAEQKVDA